MHIIGTVILMILSWLLLVLGFPIHAIWVILLSMSFHLVLILDILKSK